MPTFKVAITSTCLMLMSTMINAKSVCHGTTSNGSLDDGVKLPVSGINFVTYSYAASLAGRTYVHSEVRNILLDAYSSLEKDQPQKVYKYAETGFEEGGRFRPHRTHQNGLSVDFMTPVTDHEGNSVHLPTHPLNKLGYNIEFNRHGQYDDYRIDYEALAAHLVALDKSASARGYKIWRVIFAPELQAGLFNTQYSQYIKSHIQLSKKRSWVRHDEHYHVDFVVPCQ